MNEKRNKDRLNLLIEIRNYEWSAMPVKCPISNASELISPRGWVFPQRTSLHSAAVLLNEWL